MAAAKEGLGLLESTLGFFKRLGRGVQAVHQGGQAYGKVLANDIKGVKAGISAALGSGNISSGEAKVLRSWNTGAGRKAAGWSGFGKEIIGDGIGTAALYGGLIGAGVNSAYTMGSNIYNNRNPFSGVFGAAVHGGMLGTGLGAGYRLGTRLYKLGGMAESGKLRFNSVGKGKLGSVKVNNLWFQ